jgi:hypothetical protein
LGDADRQLILPAAASPGRSRLKQAAIMVSRIARIKVESRKVLSLIRFFNCMLGYPGA